MQYDEGLDLSRHAIAEHHDMDEMIEKLNDGRISDATWIETCKELIHEVRHHLEEEEQKFFKDAKKILATEQQQRLGALYLVEHQQFEKNNAE
ncbi:hemerythrin domain-containing protein [Acinetobacter sp. c2-A9]|uniref:hemerythrin domain-containing protein n=1 Tax=Acinetobacter sp. c2-A9 TaxID=3342802 RepID=UPI0035B9C569